MSVDSSYNGWANFKTWSLYCWLTSDESTYHAIRNVVKFANRNGSLYSVAAAIREFVDDEMFPRCLDGTWASDLLSSALDDVDMKEIAKAFLEDIED